MTDAEVDAVIDRLIATCCCGACERYRRSFALRAGAYAVKIEESLRRAR